MRRSAGAAPILMSSPFVLNTTVSYKDVDREEFMLLSGIFKLFQEGAIQHANEHDLGTRTMDTREESWVLNRVATSIQRYPRHEESLRLETWSSGIHGFRGYREYRFYVGDELAVSASSLWVYLNLRTKALTRVPAALAERFPARPDPRHEPNLDKLPFFGPQGESARALPITLRYSDVDGNGHVNNTTYLELVQTALARAALPPRPAQAQIKFMREIPPSAETATVHLETRGSSSVFSVTDGANVCAVGLTS